MLPEIEQISDTICIFKGERYWKSVRYFSRNGKLLHRVFWESRNGPIPAGYVIHHINGNGYDNRIENLEMLSAGEHMSLHNHTLERVLKSKVNILAAHEYSRTALGKAEMSIRSKEWWSKREATEHVCPVCGTRFMSRDTKIKLFCSSSCARASRRMRKREAKRLGLQIKEVERIA